jgi:hypothetical protein
VAQHVLLHLLLLVEHLVRAAQVLDDVAAAGPDDAGVVSRHHRVVGADGAVHGASDTHLLRAELDRALDALRVAPEYLGSHQVAIVRHQLGLHKLSATLVCVIAR